MNKSPYINNPDILFCHETRKTRPVQLDFEGAEMLPAGTLISCEGKAVNDATALGVLLYDTWAGYGSGTANILIAGHVDLAKAQECGGCTYTAAAKSAMKNIIFVGDTEAPAGGSAQPDWNQDDEKTPDYVKNRTHYDYNFGSYTLLEDVEIEFEDGWAYPEYELPIDFTDTISSVIVIMDNIKYELNVNEYWEIGNLHIYDPEYYEDTGEPFYMCLSDETIDIAVNDNVNHTFSISIKAYSTKKLDVRYIPDDCVIAHDYDGNSLGNLIIPTRAEDTGEYQLYKPPGYNNLLVRMPSSVQYTFPTVAVATSFTNMPVDVGDAVNTTSQTADLNTLLSEEIVVNFHVQFRLTFGSDVYTTYIIPAQHTIKNSMYIMSGLFYNDGKIYSVTVEQTSELADGRSVDVKKTITRIL